MSIAPALRVFRAGRDIIPVVLTIGSQIRCGYRCCGRLARLVRRRRQHQRHQPRYLHPNENSPNQSSPVYSSHLNFETGLFAGTVGTRRLLKLFEKYSIKASWFIPGQYVFRRRKVPLSSRFALSWKYLFRNLAIKCTRLAKFQLFKAISNSGCR